MKHLSGLLFFHIYHNCIITLLSLKQASNCISPTLKLLFLFQGKTLTTIALILTNFHKGKPLPVERCVSV